MQPHDTTLDIPYGFCQCGCGEKTKIATYTSQRYGIVKGQPVRFVHNHHSRKPKAPAPNPSGICMCGCGKVTPISKRNRPDGSVQGEHICFIKNHWARTQPAQDLTERFWRKVDKRGPIHPVLGTACWLWLGAKNDQGYGHIASATNDNGKRPMVRASRLSYEIANGPIPKGLLACHKCDNPPCVNPEHLFVGTHQDNSDDMMQKGRKRSRAKKDVV